MTGQLGADAAGGGGAVVAPAGEAGTPVLRWSSRARSIDGVQAELTRIWAELTPSLSASGNVGAPERRVAARSSVMNLVVIAGRGEVGERVAAIVEGLSGRHPSRTVVVSQADPDGPAWLDAQIQAHCVMPSETAPETCSELVYLTAGGQAGQHLAGLIAPLLIHDLPVTVWWAGEPRFGTPATRDLLELADRILVDGSGWSGDGVARLAEMARMPGQHGVDVCDFALLRQARWREAIASTFDRPALLPYLSRLARIDVSYAARDPTPGRCNVVKPLYHVAWLASRLRYAVDLPLRPDRQPEAGFSALLRDGRRRVPVALRPVESPAPGGTTLAVDLEARLGASALRVNVTAFADGVAVRASLDGVDFEERRFMSPRKREGDLLADAIESAGRDPVAAAALRMAAAISGQPVGGRRDT